MPQGNGAFTADVGAGVLNQFRHERDDIELQAAGQSQAGDAQVGGGISDRSGHERGTIELTEEPQGAGAHPRIGMGPEFFQRRPRQAGLPEMIECQQDGGRIRRTAAETAAQPQPPNPPEPGTKPAA